MCGYMSDAEYRMARRIEMQAIAARNRRLLAEAAEAQRRVDQQRADEEMRKAIAARTAESNRQHALDHSAAGMRSTTKRVNTRALV